MAAASSTLSAPRRAVSSVEGDHLPAAPAGPLPSHGLPAPTGTNDVPSSALAVVPSPLTSCPATLAAGQPSLLEEPVGRPTDGPDVLPD